MLSKRSVQFADNGINQLHDGLCLVKTSSGADGRLVGSIRRESSVRVGALRRANHRLAFGRGKVYKLYKWMTTADAAQKPQLKETFVRKPFAARKPVRFATLCSAANAR